MQKTVISIVALVILEISIPQAPTNIKEFNNLFSLLSNIRVPFLPMHENVLEMGQSSWIWIELNKIIMLLIA